VIGAGAAGLAAGKALLDAGIDFDWFEKGSFVGGLWQIDNDNGGAAAYESLHTNSSRPLTQYPSFPMPADWPDYPSHELMAQYFEAYADAFGLWEYIRFNTAVERVERLPDGGWEVTTSDGTTRQYAHVVVANGHHSVPKVPTFPGSFTGRIMHAHDYRTPDIFRGKRVLVVGVGNSGMDIACDASRNAEATYLSTRHGVHVLPKYALGKPIDQLSNPLTAYLPFEVERRLYEAIVRVAAGTPTGRGLPKPDHRLLGAHPTVSAELLDRLGHGEITMKPDITSLDGTTASFVDGTSAEVDLVVLATGYRITFPFLDPALIDPADNQLRLYQRVVPPHLPGLWFVGFIQTVGSGIALFEYQAQWVADLIAGRCSLPSAAEMEHWLAADQRALGKRYLRSTRHTIQVDYWRYIRALQSERGRSSLVGRLRSLLPV
jgi:hypothetical protein